MHPMMNLCYSQMMRMLWVLLILFAGNSPSWATVYYVDNDAAPGGDGLSWGTAFTSLQEAVDADYFDGAVGDEIWIAEGRYTSTGSTVVKMSEGSHLYGGFAGNETDREQRDWKTYQTIIDGQLTQQCIWGTNDNVIDGIILKNGHHPDWRGGGIFFYEATATISNCIFENNQSVLGGAICDYFSTLTVSDCTFKENLSISRISTYGGGMLNAGSDLELVNCVFENNQSNAVGPRNGFGGGMHNAYATVTVTDCTFNGNSAKSDSGQCFGGGISNYYTEISIKNSSISGGSISSQNICCGGGMFNHFTTSNLLNCTLSDNTTTSTLASSFGGGICNIDSESTILNCSFNDNEVYSEAEGEGGGLYNESSSLTISNCQFTRNLVLGNSEYCHGGGMSSLRSSPVVTDCVFTENHLICLKTWSFGGGMSNQYDTPIVENCTFVGNIVEGTQCRGGGLYNGGCTGNITNSIFRKNIALNGRPSRGGGIFNAACYNLIEDCIISENRATNPGYNSFTYGGGIENYFGAPTVSKCIIEKNITDGLGSGISNYHSSPLILDCIISGNGNDESHGGGGIANVEAYSIIRGCYIGQNSAMFGGGVNCMDPPYDKIKDEIIEVEISDCVLERNVASYEGGGLLNVFCEITVLNCLFDSNTVSSMSSTGGAVSTSRDFFSRFLNSTFVNNSANNGGAFDIDRSQSIISGCLFQNNAAKYSGGSIYNKDSAPKLVSCTFKGGSAKNGGVIYNLRSSPVIAECLMEDNEATNNGGGIYSKESLPVVRKCQFYNNTALNGGGWASNESSSLVENCLFAGNISSNNGGGVYDEYTSGTTTIKNCTLSGNVSSTLDGGSCVVGTDSVYMTNCILWGNEPEVNSADLSTSTTTYNCIQGGHEGEGNIESDPLFVDAGNRNFRLQPSSPCIDSGASVEAPEDDIRNFPRPGGAGVDMGAYEFWEVSPSFEVIQILLGHQISSGYGDLNTDGCIDAADLLIE